MSLMTHEGTLAAVTGQPDLIGKDATVLHPEFHADWMVQFRRDEPMVFQHPDGNLEVFVPIAFGETDTPWVVNVNVPHAAVVARPSALLWQLVIISIVLTAGILALLWIIAQQIAQPVREMSVVAREVASGNLDVTAQTTSTDEIGELTKVFNQMVASMRQAIDVERKAVDAERTAKQATEEAQKVQQQLIHAQRDALRELSSPLIPISDDVVIMPLIGTIDSQRASQIMEALLEGIARYKAKLVILDITGVSTVDTQVAQALIQTAQAVRLLGAQVMLTGIQPQIAQTLVHLGVELPDIITRGTLQAGIGYALSERVSG